MKRSQWIRFQGAAIGLVAIAAVVVAIINPGSSSDAAAATQSTNALGTALCYGFGRASIGQYHETVGSLPLVVAEAKKLSSSSRWQAVGDALAQVTTLGPTTTWTPSQRSAGRKDFQALHAACTPHLR